MSMICRRKVLTQFDAETNFPNSHHIRRVLSLSVTPTIMRPFSRYPNITRTLVPYRRYLSSLPQGRLPQGYTQPTPAKDDLIIVAMSSGVDSSVAASLYAKEFPRVQGLFMSNWNQLDSERCLEEDWKDVQKVCDQLKIPLEQASFEKEYWLDVFEPMIEGYAKGITPNPDINCNRYVKFGRLIEYVAQKYNKERWWLVTGHYSRILTDVSTGAPHLLRSFYKKKDQSYYLSQINPNVLHNVLLPIGHFTKPEVRDMAHNLALPVADKPDSTGLCFVNPTQGNFQDFLRNFITETPGKIITEDGKVWGDHDGLWNFTIGQKCGISMPQGDPKYKGTWFVSEKRYETNEVVIVRGGDNEKLFKSVVYVDAFKTLEDGMDLKSFNVSELTVQYRSLQEPSSVKSITKGKDDKFVFELTQKRRAIAQGQYLGVYHGDRCLGSGVIEFVE